MSRKTSLLTFAAAAGVGAAIVLAVKDSQCDRLRDLKSRCWKPSASHHDAPGGGGGGAAPGAVPPPSPYAA